jgi:hypothetical protein
MSLCALCGHPTVDAGLCAYHGTVYDDWAIGNRVMCDFIHRGIVLPTTPRRSRSRLEVAADHLSLEAPVAA